MRITKISIKQEMSALLGLKKELKHDDDLIALAVLYLLKYFIPTKLTEKGRREKDV